MAARKRTRLKAPQKRRYTAPVGAKGFELVVRGKLDPKGLGAELRRLREAANVTVSDLAGRMGWHTANVSRLERGGTERGNAAREPTISSVALYVRTLGYELVLTSRPKKPLRRKSTGSAGTDAAEAGAMGTASRTSGEDE
jgi:transcriptional regulator with XRE-family HTH domain